MLGTWRRPRFDVSQGGYNTSTMPARLSRHRRTRISYPWTPRSIPGLVFWVAADKITGLNDADAVTTWSDLSDNHLDFIAFGSRTITYQTAEINGLPCVDFLSDADGGLQTANGADMSYIQDDFTIFAVYNWRTEYGPSAFFHKGDAGTAAGSKWSFIMEWNGDTLGGFATYVGSASSNPQWTPTALEWGRFSGVRHQGKSDIKFDDTTSGLQTASATQTGSSNQITGYKPTIGGLSTGTFPPDCQIAEMFFYDHALTDADRFRAEDYLLKKYGI